MLLLKCKLGLGVKIEKELVRYWSASQEIRVLSFAKCGIVFFFKEKQSNRCILMWVCCTDVIVLKLDEPAPLDIVINHCGKQTIQSAPKGVV